MGKMYSSKIKPVGKVIFIKNVCNEEKSGEYNKNLSYITMVFRRKNFVVLLSRLWTMIFNQKTWLGELSKLVLQIAKVPSNQLQLIIEI